MNKYDVIIIGGGAAGLSCALTLGSTQGKGEWAENRSILFLDAGRSDILGARFYNAAGLPSGILGLELLQNIRSQLTRYEQVHQKEGMVTQVTGEKGNFSVSVESGENFLADAIVLATGFHGFKIEGLGLEVVENKKSYKENKIQIEHTDFLVRPGLYVAGLLAGVSSQFIIAAGSGAQVACNIMAEWAGKNTVVHDKP